MADNVSLCKSNGFKYEKIATNENESETMYSQVWFIGFLELL